MMETVTPLQKLIIGAFVAWMKEYNLLRARAASAQMDSVYNGPCAWAGAKRTGYVSAMIDSRIVPMPIVTEIIAAANKSTVYRSCPLILYPNGNIDNCVLGYCTMCDEEGERLAVKLTGGLDKSADS